MLFFDNEISNVAVYPNPGTDRLYIDHLNPAASVKLFDAGGRLTIEQTSASDRMEIGLGHLPAGSCQVMIMLGGSSYSVPATILKK